jgi:hypothetical protein
MPKNRSIFRVGAGQEQALPIKNFGEERGGNGLAKHPLRIKLFTN